MRKPSAATQNNAVSHPASQAERHDVSPRHAAVPPRLTKFITKRRRLEAQVLKLNMDAAELAAKALDRSHRGGRALYRHWGFNSFEDFCTVVLGGSERAGYNSVAVGRLIRNGSISVRDVQNIAWDKVALVAELVNTGRIPVCDIPKWVQLARDLTAKQLQEKAKVARKRPRRKLRPESPTVVPISNVTQASPVLESQMSPKPQAGVEHGHG